MKIRWVSCLLFLCAVLGVGTLTGCGGGSSNSRPNPNPNPNGSRSLVSGTVTDVNGSPIVGATVTFNGQTATSTQFGTFTIPNVAVPAGQSSVIGTAHATVTISGTVWSGQNMVEVLSGEPDTSNIQIVLSPAASQNSITGTVVNAQGQPLPGARVFASVGPFTDSTGAQSFANLSSFQTTANQTGGFTLPQLPPSTSYTVTASFAGYINQTQTNVTVNAPPAAPTNIAFQLNTATNSPTPPQVTGVSAIAITTPSTPNRAAGQTNASAGTNALKQWIFARKGLLKHHTAASSRVTLKKVTRDTPVGSIIEADIFWDYVPINNLFGYEVAQATSLSPPNFTSIALIRDPLADRFADVDLGLTPDATYYYSIARLDTINFPNGNANLGEGSPSDTRAIQPLGPISQTAPSSGSTPNSRTPTFSWTAVNRAAFYQVLVYDRYPTLQSDTDTQNGVQPIWPPSSQQPGTSLVAAPGTSVVYAGPALITGHTYYWAVLAQDNVGSAFSVSPIQSFVAP